MAALEISRGAAFAGPAGYLVLDFAGRNGEAS